VSKQCDDRKSTSILPLVSVVGLYQILCLLFASRPQIKFMGFTEFRKVCMGLRFVAVYHKEGGNSWLYVLEGLLTLLQIDCRDLKNCGVA